MICSLSFTLLCSVSFCCLYQNTMVHDTEDWTSQNSLWLVCSYVQSSNIRSFWYSYRYLKLLDVLLVYYLFLLLLTLWCYPLTFDHSPDFWSIRACWARPTSNRSRDGSLQRFRVCSSRYFLHVTAFILVSVSSFLYFKNLIQVTCLILWTSSQFAQLEHAKAAQSLNGKLEIAGRTIKVSAWELDFHVLTDIIRHLGSWNSSCHLSSESFFVGSYAQLSLLILLSVICQFSGVLSYWPCRSTRFWNKNCRFWWWRWRWFGEFKQ